MVAGSNPVGGSLSGSFAQAGSIAVVGTIARAGISTAESEDSQMTTRKPPGVSFESWVDKQIREAVDRGEFDNLPGTGKPLPDAGEPDDENWWLKKYLRQEGVGGD